MPWKLIRENGLEDRVFPLHGDARFPPFAEEYFDAVVSVDSYQYYGTDVEYLQDTLLPIFKQGGQLGMISAAAVTSLRRPLLEGVESWVHRVNCVDWWKEHWDRNPGVNGPTPVSYTGGLESRQTLPH